MNIRYDADWNTEKESAKGGSDQLLSIDLHSSKKPASQIKRSHTHLCLQTKTHTYTHKGIE